MSAEYARASLVLPWLGIGAAQASTNRNNSCFQTGSTPCLAWGCSARLQAWPCLLGAPAGSVTLVVKPGPHTNQTLAPVQMMLPCTSSCVVAAVVCLPDVSSSKLRERMACHPVSCIWLVNLLSKEAAELLQVHRSNTANSRLMNLWKQALLEAQATILATANTRMSWKRQRSLATSTSCSKPFCPS